MCTYVYPYSIIYTIIDVLPKALFSLRLYFVRVMYEYYVHPLKVVV